MPSARKLKLKLKLATSRPRNPLVAPALQRKAGKHETSQKSRRRSHKIALQLNKLEDPL